jgi:predicted transcriptional regulator
MEKYIMVSFDDEKIKFLSEVLGNKTCKKILVFLLENQASESEISKELKIPLNTVDYNIKKLVNTGLIEKATHWWSVKGKKIPVYKVSNKKIIISPIRKLSSIKTLIPGIIISGIGALLIKGLIRPVQFAKDSALESGLKAAEAGGNLAASQNALDYLYTLPPWMWFLIGAWFGLVLFLIITFIRRKKI